MSTETKENQIRFCSFCGASEYGVNKLVANCNSSAFICDGCVGECQETIYAHSQEDSLRFLRTEMMLALSTSGVRVIDRPFGVSFGEQNPLILMDSVSRNGFYEGSRVYLRADKTPWRLPSSEEKNFPQYEASQAFIVVCFVELEGEIKSQEAGKQHRRMETLTTFAVLSKVQRGSTSRSPSVEYNEDGKVLLFPIECLRRKKQK